MAGAPPLSSGEEMSYPKGSMMYSYGSDGEDRRLRLRRLDDCLTVLEQAHENNLTHVTEVMAHMVSERVPTIYEGMLITDAIEEVLRQQEPYMTQIRPETNKRVRRRRDPFDIRVLLYRH